MSVVTPLGLPGAGKGTQAVCVDEHPSISVISTGEIFRSDMAEGTEIGKQTKLYMDRGESALDLMTNAMVKTHLSAPGTAQDFLPGGYPRNIEQAQVSAGFCEELGTYIGVILEIQVNEDEVVVHTLKRAEEQHRADGSELVMCHRPEVYREQTEPVASFYTDLGLLETVDGSGSIDEVNERIFTVFDARLGR